MNEIIKALYNLSLDIKEVKQSIKDLNERYNQQLKEIWIDNSDLMQILKISPRTLQNLRDNGEIPFTRLKGKIYYNLHDVNKILLSKYKRKERGNNGNH